ncbi:MAG: putative toxin-antitoxin system toxin component, PIN family [Thermoanaerobaculia bacterium]
MNRRAAVVDTNVVVAALLTSDPRSPTAKVLDAMLDGRFPFLLSTALLAEYRQVLLRPKIRTHHGLTEDEIDRLLTELITNAIVREPEPSSHQAPEPGDQHLWDLLATEAGTVLVTGDRRLLQGPPPNILVQPPASFMTEIEG